MSTIFKDKRILLTVGFIISLLVIGLLIRVLSRPQETRTRALQATKLYFGPASTAFLPIRTHVNEEFSVDIMVDPGQNALSFVKFEVSYPENVLDFSVEGDIEINTDVFPVTLEGPVGSLGRIAASVSIGNDAGKSVTSPVKVATLYFRPKIVTDESVQLQFGSSSEALSIASTDQAGENVLSGADPAYILVEALPTATVTPQPTATVTPSPRPSSTAAPSPTSGQRKVSYTIVLHGIGLGGDNTNPTESQFSNKEPRHRTRDVTFSFFDASQRLAASLSGTIQYSSESGKFSGEVLSNEAGALQGNYSIIIYSRGYLRQSVQGFVELRGSEPATIGETALVTGDVDNDNRLSILDYNQITDCYSDLAPARNCDASKKERTDITDDGKVNQFDYNLFLRELKVQPGR